MPEGVGYSGSNVVAGTGKELNYVGEFAYAMSGPIQIAGGSNTIHLEFTSGNKLIVGKFTFFGGAIPANTGIGTLSIFRIRVNGNTSNLIKVETTSEDMPSVITIPFLIPPYTTIQIAAENGDSTTNMVVESNFVGRVYE